MSRTNRERGGLMKLVFLLVGAVVLFTAGLAGTLSFRGKLNQETIGTLLGHPPPAEPAPESELDALHARLAESDGEETAADPMLPRIALPSPFSSMETKTLFKELMTVRANVRARLESVQQEERDLGLVRAELSRRFDDLTRREEELEERMKSFAAERQALESRSVVLKEAELANLKQLAGDIEKMKAPSAAALLMEKPPERVALILSFVKSRESGKILAEMPPEFADEVTDKALGILRPGDLEKEN